uniref:uncharacterized protein LOC120331825 n=1 Tax=Styela clava TaxID=7725 RepID=UPI00193AA7A6|nr:uncharacterized protein LOC120331825 [Styela clava]
MKVELQELSLEKVEIPDLRRLKELSERLQLSPKRESVIQWQNDLRELQSEGIYPIPLKLKKEANSSVEPNSAPIITNKSEQNKQRKDDSSSTTKSKSFDSATDTNCVISTIENLKRQSKPGIQLTQVQTDRTASLNVNNCKIDDTKIRKPYASKYFRQRSIEDSQKKIKQYALRLDAKSEIDIQNKENETTGARYKRMGMALERLRTDLLDMRIQDNNLARQLLDGRHDLVQLRAQKTCDEHATMLDDFTWELELEEELTEQLRSSDLPSAFLRGPNSLLGGTSPLRLIGITRLSMDSKRFSVI